MLEDRVFKARQRAIWAQGDYHRVATSALWDFGPLLVAACGIGPGQRVLDVAAGTGNVAIRAAEAGAQVVASDLTPENFDAGRREASEHGVQLEWVVADAEALPFGDGEFDVVTSCSGAIFAPHHQTVADELVRVCRAGGTIGLITIVPASAVLDLFDIVTRYAQTPMLGEQSPLDWGREQHVRELFGDRVEFRSFEHRVIQPSPLDDVEFLKAQHPVLVDLYRGVAADSDRTAALDRELDAMSKRRAGERQQTLLVVARKR
jgi:SAM-dependent methyltransferase